MRKVLFLLIFCVAVFGLTVHDIQYSTTGSSPYDGDTVTISAVVTAISYSGDKYFIGDAGGGPWSGVYVYDYSHPADAGDRVTIICEVDEYYSLTELKNVTSFVIDSSGSVPPPYSTTCAVVETSEALEGVLVTLSNLIVTDDNDTMWEVQDASGLMKVLYGFDYSYVPNPGDTVTTLTGMVYYSRGRFVIEPRFNADIVVSGGTPTEFVPIADIQAHPDSFTDVRVRGVVTVAAGKLHSTQLKAYMQDASGKGIQLFDYTMTPEMLSGMVRGAVIEVTGAVSEYLGTTEITVDSWSVVGLDTLPTILPVVDVWDAALDYEGTWMTTEGSVVDIYMTGVNDWNITVDAAVANVPIRVWGTVGAVLDSLKIGDHVRVNGVGGTYSSAFQLLPGDSGDVIFGGGNIPTEAEPEINVQAGVLAPTLGEVDTIQFAVPKGNRAILRIFDRMGRSISTLYDGTMYTGASIAWDGRDETNAILPCGVYLIRLESISISGERKFTTKTIAIGSVLK